MSGSSLIKAGTVVERYQDNMFNPTFSLGIFTFNSVTDFLRNTPVRFIGISPNGALDRYWRFTLAGFYLQDSFRAHNRLTLNAGVRYEAATLPVDINGRDSALINLTDRTPTVGPLYQNPTLRNFSPRVGFAWDVFGNGRTVSAAGMALLLPIPADLIVTVITHGKPRPCQHPDVPSADFHRPLCRYGRYSTTE